MRGHVLVRGGEGGGHSLVNDEDRTAGSEGAPGGVEDFDGLAHVVQRLEDADEVDGVGEQAGIAVEECHLDPGGLGPGGGVFDGGGVAVDADPRDFEARNVWVVLARWAQPIMRRRTSCRSRRSSCAV